MVFSFLVPIPAGSLHLSTESDEDGSSEGRQLHPLGGERRKAECAQASVSGDARKEEETPSPKASIAEITYFYNLVPIKAPTVSSSHQQERTT